MSDDEPRPILEPFFDYQLNEKFTYRINGAAAS